MVTGVKGSDTINLSKLDFKSDEIKKVGEKSKTINLSKLDFKKKKKVAVNISKACYKSIQTGF